MAIPSHTSKELSPNRIPLTVKPKVMKIDRPNVNCDKIILSEKKADHTLVQ